MSADSITKVPKRDYIPANLHSGTPFTEEELADITDKVKEAFVSEAKERFPRTAIIAANAMLGAYMITKKALYMLIKENTDGSH